jgi:hypothetical protein
VTLRQRIADVLIRIAKRLDEHRVFNDGMSREVDRLVTENESLKERIEEGDIDE